VKGRRAIVALVLVLIAAPAAAQGQGTPQVRLAASASCPTTPGCGAGLKRVYKLDVSAFLVTVPAGQGISALDAGTAEVGSSFTTDPELSRPDILELRDDRHMLGSDHIVPVVRRAAKRVGPGARRRLDAASALLSTLALRHLNQELIDGRRAAAVAADFVDSNGLGGSGRIKPNTNIVVGYMDFAEDEILAHIYAEALRAGGYDARVKAVHGLRPEAVAALKKRTIDLYPGYARSLAEYLTDKEITASDVRPQLVRALGPIGAQAARFAPGSDANVFAVKRDTAAALGLSTISDLGKYWPGVP